EMEAFTQFASDLDDATKAQLNHGGALMELLKQPLCQPLSLADQVILLTLANNGYFDSVPKSEIRKAKEEVLNNFHASHPTIIDAITNGTDVNDLKKLITDAAGDIAVPAES
ncbi:MAG: F0F1 ATP synthase subunit alpha, partial [Eubacterium sp.]|nr:F0F1 ATP synthase subunit alpha [Eubacterium sp.]